jgi:hypothetical protein
VDLPHPPARAAGLETLRFAGGLEVAFNDGRLSSAVTVAP